MKTSISLFLLLTLLTCCTDNDEDLFTRPYPVVKTNLVTYSTVTGEFNGEIIAMNGNQIQDHGFEYIGFGYSTQKISLGELTEGSKFSVSKPSISNPSGSTFSVRAYVTANGVTVVGNAAYFIP